MPSAARKKIEWEPKLKMTGIGFTQPKSEIIMAKPGLDVNVSAPRPFNDFLGFYQMMNTPANQAYFAEFLPTFPAMVDTRSKTFRHLAGNARGVANGIKYYGIIRDQSHQQMVGRLSAWPAEEDNALEVAYLVRPERSGQGIASATLKHFVNLAASSGNISAVRASILPQNEGSQAVVSKSNFYRTDEVYEIGGLPHDVWRIDL